MMYFKPSSKDWGWLFFVWSSSFSSFGTCPSMGGRA